MDAIHTTQGDAFLSDFSVHSVRKHLQIMFQATSLNNLMESSVFSLEQRTHGSFRSQLKLNIPFVIVCLAKRYVFLHSCILYPWGLRKVRHAIIEDNLIQERSEGDEKLPVQSDVLAFP